MGGPARVADAVGAVDWLQPDGFFEVAQLAFGAADLQPVPIAGYSYSGRVIAAIFKPSQSVEDDGNDTLLADVTNNTAHAETPIDFSVSEGKAELFDHRVGQNIASDALDFYLRFIAREPAVQS